MGIFNKRELEQIDELKKENESLKATLNSLGGNDLLSVKKEIGRQRIILKQIVEELGTSQTELESIKAQISEKKKELANIDSDLDMMDFGLYEPKYQCMNSDEYSEKIKANREEQKMLIKNKCALNYYDEWRLDGSLSKGRAMNNDNMKMYLRAFNNECDVLISKAKFNNVDKIMDRIGKCANALDKLNARNKISVTPEYLKLKYEELFLVHEYNEKKQEEKEAMRAAREEERERVKLQKEIEEKRKSFKKEQAHYLNARKKLIEQLKGAGEDEKKDIVEKIREIDENLEVIDISLKDIDYREANQKAGYVYVISNIGSFGDEVYKIGMTRRLDPQDRVDELGDASVPFRFDVHAMIFSDDAPALESALHRAFEDRKVNMVNNRKEFFNVSLDEIEQVVKANHDKLVEFNKVAYAEQFRESIKMRELMQKHS